MPPAHEAEAERIRALPRKELQALAKELGVKANGKTVTILDDVLAALEAQVSSAEASPLEQKPGSPNHTASPAQDTGCHRACPVSHEQTGAACQHEMSAASPENAHIESEHARTKQVPTASNVSGSHFQEASMAVQHAEQVNSAADPPPEPVTVSSNPFFEPANAVPSTAADDSAHKAFVKGRESGIWQGAKQVQLQDLETQWDTYKAGTKRGLELPNLADVHQRSVALAESGFTTADSPNIRASTRSAIHLPAAGSKRKAGDIDETGAEKLEPAQQPPAKRQTPAKRAAWNSPFRPARTAVPRIPSASALQPRDNVDASLTPSGRKILHAKRTLSLKEPSVPDKPAEAIARDTQPGPARKLAPPKPPSHVDRAKKAAEVFTARRAAALAKARE
ncbi:hypothetical protein WJX84_004923 [Apatococcus fuscideae]|uniref:SAP domain-containing protein n=1 Tax=Apatococcus fuscideae TaxID=2026836 RepID=A0AAW1SYB2_9CHLO